MPLGSAGLYAKSSVETNEDGRKAFLGFVAALNSLVAPGNGVFELT